MQRKFLCRNTEEFLDEKILGIARNYDTVKTSYKILPQRRQILSNRKNFHKTIIEDIQTNQ